MPFYNEYPCRLEGKEGSQLEFSMAICIKIETIEYKYFQPSFNKIIS